MPQSAGLRCLNQKEKQNAMDQGSIKMLKDKCFVSIKTWGEKDLFFHSSSVTGANFDDLREGQKVTYTEGRGPKGPCAENVKPA